MDLGSLPTGRWAWATADFTHNSVPESGSSGVIAYGDGVTDISFIMAGAAGTDDFYLDEIYLYEPR